MKQAVALLLNDIHAGKDNLSEFAKNWDEALDICKERGIEYLVVGGDMWQARANQTLSTLLEVDKAVRKATAQGLTLILANGNHDKTDQENTLGYNHLFAHYDDVTVVDVAHSICIDSNLGLWLTTMSYFPENGSFPQRLEDAKEFLPSGDTILYIHQGINGALATSSEDELPASLFKDFRKVLVGHYHDRCKVGDNIEYIGASRQHNFGEDEEKGYTILYSNGSTEFIKNQVNTRFTTFTIKADTPEDIQVEIKKAVENGNKVRVKVECKAEDAALINKQAILDMGVSKLEIKAETPSVEAVSQALETKYDKTGIKSEYVTFCDRKNIKDVETGLCYLDKIQ